MDDQERADLVSAQLGKALAPTVLTMPDREWGGPCAKCGKLIQAGEKYIEASDGFADHARCRGE